MFTHERYTNRDCSNIAENLSAMSISKKKYISPTLTELSTSEKIEGGNFTGLNENSSGLVSGAAS